MQVDGQTRVQRGWLTDEVLVQIKIHGGGLDLWRKKEAGGRVFAKLTTLGRREGEGEESLDMAEMRDNSTIGSWPVVEAAVRIINDNMMTTIIIADDDSQTLRNNSE